MFRTVARCVGLGLLIAAVLFGIATVATAHRGDRNLWPAAPGVPTAEVFVVNHGYHSGIVIPRELMGEQSGRRDFGALREVARRFADYDRLEIGWGDEGFYRAVPTIDALTVGLALRALLLPGNPSVLHVVGVKDDPRAMFSRSEIVRLDLSELGFERLLNKLDATFARVDGLPQDLGPGLYGPSLFFRANDAFHLFNVCNHWIAGLLDAAGVPTAPVLATLPFGLLLDLEWRSGLSPLPKGVTPPP